MKFIDLKPLNIPRLKAYRKSILAKISGYELCSCGSEGCDFGRSQYKDDPSYINLCLVRDRVNKELSRKQRAEYDAKQNPAHVYTIAEEKRWMGKKRTPRR